MRAGIVPCSDMAGEVVAAGADAAAQWGTGDRVAANFTFALRHGAGSPDGERAKTPDVSAQARHALARGVGWLIGATEDE